MQATRDTLQKHGYPGRDLSECPSSLKRFSDGAQYRMEIPSTEGPVCFRAVLEEAKTRGVPVHRISQGSGIMLLTDDEICEMVSLGKANNIEVNLFVGPRATFDIGAQGVSIAGSSIALSLRGADQVVFALEDVKRAISLGIHSILVADLGLLAIMGSMKQAGELPNQLIIKTSVMMAPANPASARVLEDLGATTINVPSDLTLPQLAAIRSAIDTPIDFYIEAPDNIGGFIRHFEVAELISVCSPIYLKLGLRNAPDIYPSGTHIETTAVALSRERVRRAQIVCGMIRRYAPGASMSKRL